MREYIPILPEEEKSEFDLQGDRYIAMVHCYGCHRTDVKVLNHCASGMCPNCGNQMNRWKTCSKRFSIDL